MVKIPLILGTVVALVGAFALPGEIDTFDPRVAEIAQAIYSESADIRAVIDLPQAELVAAEIRNDRYMMSDREFTDFLKQEGIEELPSAFYAAANPRGIRYVELFAAMRRIAFGR